MQSTPISETGLTIESLVVNVVDPEGLCPAWFEAVTDTEYDVSGSRPVIVQEVVVDVQERPPGDAVARYV